MDEIKNFRQHRPRTPGHPEFPSYQHNTPGIEATTGPLGAGIGNAVGMAAAAKLAAAKYNARDHKIFNQHVNSLCGDGCLQDEAASFAGHLIATYDSNDVTLDKMADFTQSVDHAMIFEALGWNDNQIDGNDSQAVATIQQAKAAKNGRPAIITANTVIGKGIPEVEGSNAAHGEAGVKYQDAVRKSLGLPEVKFFASPDTREYFEKHEAELKAQRDA